VETERSVRQEFPSSELFRILYVLWQFGSDPLLIRTMITLIWVAGTVAP